MVIMFIYNDVFTFKEMAENILISTPGQCVNNYLNEVAITSEMTQCFKFPVDKTQCFTVCIFYGLSVHKVLFSITTRCALIESNMRMLRGRHFLACFVVHIYVCLNNVFKVLIFTVGWGTTQQQGFGEEPGMKTQMLHLIRSIRTVMRSRF